MIRTFTKSLALLLLASATFTACKKDKDDESLAVTKDNLVATYTVASIKMKSGSTEKDVTNDPNYVEQCEKDDELTLKADMTLQIKDAGTQCSPTSSGPGTWSITGNTLTIDGDENTIKSLSKNSLVLENSWTVSGVTFTITTTLNRK
ncbi:MAG TPA: lipocalin family protein [Niastella sp.]